VSDPKPVTIAINDDARVSGLLLAPKNARACYVLAHGAGAGMNHAFMAAVATELAERGIATLRYQFPYMEQGSKRPDVAEAARLMPKLPLFAGGRSFGGRMTSQAQAAEPLAGVRGLIFLGFPLHPAGKPSQERGEHLFDVKIPMLFLQGSRDQLALLDQIEPVWKELGKRATLVVIPDADHSFHVPAKTGKKDTQVRSEVLDRLAAWIDGVLD
jgi:uncharacterized protein